LVTGIKRPSVPPLKLAGGGVLLATIMKASPSPVQMLLEEFTENVKKVLNEAKVFDIRS